MIWFVALVLAAWVFVLASKLGDLRRQVGSLENGQFGKLVDQLGDVSHLILLGGAARPMLSCVERKGRPQAA